MGKGEYCTQCKKHKLVYKTQLQAERWLKRFSLDALSNRGKCPFRIYYCESCDAYHTTSTFKNHYDTQKCIKMYNESKLLIRSKQWDDALEYINLYIEYLDSLDSSTSKFAMDAYILKINLATDMSTDIKYNKDVDNIIFKRKIISKSLHLILEISKCKLATAITKKIKDAEDTIIFHYSSLCENLIQSIQNNIDDFKLNQLIIYGIQVKDVVSNSRQIIYDKTKQHRIQNTAKLLLAEICEKIKNDYIQSDIETFITKEIENTFNLINSNSIINAGYLKQNMRSYCDFISYCRFNVKTIKGKIYIANSNIDYYIQGRQDRSAEKLQIKIPTGTKEISKSIEEKDFLSDIELIKSSIKAGNYNTAQAQINRADEKLRKLSKKRNIDDIYDKLVIELQEVENNLNSMLDEMY